LTHARRVPCSRASTGTPKRTLSPIESQQQRVSKTCACLYRSFPTVGRLTGWLAPAQLANLPNLILPPSPSLRANTQVNSTGQPTSKKKESQTTTRHTILSSLSPLFIPSLTLHSLTHTSRDLAVLTTVPVSWWYLLPIAHYCIRNPVVDYSPLDGDLTLNLYLSTDSAERRYLAAAGGFGSLLRFHSS
jgi:hypothetical protein